MMRVVSCFLLMLGLMAGLPMALFLAPSRAMAAPADAATDDPKLPPLRKINETRVRDNGIRKLVSKHLTLYTDLPKSVEVDELPAVFDLAFPQWCEYFQRGDRARRPWMMRGFLMKDRERFEKAGLIPTDLPRFTFGYSIHQEFWMFDQPSDYYRRHLLLHEGTHGFMNTVLGHCGPPWYMEGMAELLGTHRWDDGTLQLNYFPKNRDEVPQLGRIKLVRDAVEEGRALRLPEIMAFDASAHLQNEPYAWCWAATAFLDGHPRYRQRFRELPANVKRADFNGLMQRQFADDWPTILEEWQVFVQDLNYGHDLNRSAIQFATGKPLTTAARVNVAADHGWQSSGITLQAGQPYTMAASGRYQVANQPEIWWCEPGGVSIRYVDGRPLGMLLAGVLAETDNPAAPADEGSLVKPFGIGLQSTITPAASGVLYFRINDASAELDDNQGELQVTISSADSATDSTNGTPSKKPASR